MAAQVVLNPFSLKSRAIACLNQDDMSSLAADLVFHLQLRQRFFKGDAQERNLIPFLGDHFHRPNG